MNILIFDTETNDGAKDYKLEPKEDLNNFPYVLQLAAKLIKVDMNEELYFNESTRSKAVSAKIISEINMFVQPYRNGNLIEIAEEAFNIHGITLNKCIEEGENIVHVMSMLQGMMSFADIIICHNVGFDKPVVISEVLRLNLNLRVRPTTKLWCSMLNTIEVCKIPSVGKARYYGEHKWPKLEELYKYLFGIEMSQNYNAHDAMEDVNATTECVLELYRRDINLFEKNKT